MDKKEEIQNGNWNRWQIHVLNELERLGQSYEGLNEALLEIKEKAFGLVKQGEEITRLTREVDGLKLFKTQAVTVWAIVQFAVGIACCFIAKGAA